MTQHHFDFLAIGGGSGGIAAAVRAASHGARAAPGRHPYVAGHDSRDGEVEAAAKRPDDVHWVLGLDGFGE